MARSVETPLDFSEFTLKNSSIVVHRLRNRQSSPIWKLTKKLILDPFQSDQFQVSISRAYEIQRLYRLQVRWLMEQEVKYNYAATQEQRSQSALKLTYELNCRPSGFFATPKTLVCRSATCPWCYVRRVYKSVFLPLSQHLRKIRNLDNTPVKLIYWRQVTPFDPAGKVLPFFRANYGPHQWLNAFTTVQFAVPMLVNNGLVMRHVVFQLVPFDTPGKELLHKRALIRKATGFEYAEAKKLGDTNKKTDSLLISAIGYALCFPFHDLFFQENFQHFDQIRQSLKHKRLVRMSPIKKRISTSEEPVPDMKGPKDRG